MASCFTKAIEVINTYTLALGLKLNIDKYVIIPLLRWPCLGGLAPPVVKYWNQKMYKVIKGSIWK